MADPLGTRTVQTTCPYCGVGCGVLATPQENGEVRIEGDPGHPANFGRLCSKGSALGETLGLEGRLLYPEIAGKKADWDSALDRVAREFGRTIAEHGPDSVAFYVSGQLLTEDYYVANKLMKGFIGSANIDTNSRLCMASSVAGHKRAFGSDTVPGSYRDLELADLVVLVGSNLAWCHPVLHQRLAAAKSERPEMRIVVVDPRATATAEIADMHLPIAPDADVALFAGLLDHLRKTGHFDKRFVLSHTSGWGDALRAAKGAGLDETAQATGLSVDLLMDFFSLFAETEKTVTVYSQGVNQSESGTDKVNSILNCHLFTGRIGRPGMGPFSVTGQPNAMGGREVGGLANQLAAHMVLEDPLHRAIVQRFWGSPVIAGHQGLRAVDLFDAIGRGTVKAVWIMGTNPVDSMPNADRVAVALKNCPFVVVSDVVRRTDTTQYADVLLPAEAWGEKSGTVTNSERRISRQRAFLEAPGAVRPDWWIVAETARRMGFGAAFDYSSPAAIFREHAALSREGNDGQRDFDIGGLADIGDSEYGDLSPVQWPVRQPSESGLWDKRFFAGGAFFTEDGKARMVPTPQPQRRRAEENRFILNTGRVRDHWHTMTRTGTSPRLSRHLAEPYCEIHPDDAGRLGIAPATLVELAGAQSHVIARALVTERQQPGSLFVPMHWTDRFASAGRVGRIIETGIDPHSGQPALKAAPVTLGSYRAAWYGFAVFRERPENLDLAYWALAPSDAGWRVELADSCPVADWTAYATRLLGAGDRAPLLAYHDAGGQQFRFAVYHGNLLAGALFVAPGPVQVSRSWLAGRLAAPAATAAERMMTLAGRGGHDMPDPGATICSCFNIGINQIAAAVRAEGCRTVAEVGAVCGAGTNCGSCRSEIGGILQETGIREAVLV